MAQRKIQAGQLDPSIGTGGGGETTWDAVTGKPATYPPSPHSHVVGDVTGLQTALDGKVGTSDPRLTDARTPTAHTHTVDAITPGTGTKSATTYLNGLGVWATPPNTTYANPATSEITAGSAATQRTISADLLKQAVRFWVTGSLTTAVTAFGSSIVTAADAAAARTLLGAGTSNLALGTTSTTAKAGDWVPSWTDVTGKPATFPPSTHSHVIADVTGLQAALDGKAPTSHTHTTAQISDATALGRDLLKAPDAAAARTLIGAGTGGGGSSLPAPIVTMSAGGQGDTVSNTSTAGAAAATNRGLRIPMTFFAKPKRFRFKVRNFNCTGYGPAGNAATGQGISMGVHAGNFQFQGAQATTLVSGTYAISGTASFWFSDWITDPALMPTPGVEYLFATGYTQASTGTPNMAMQCGLNTNAAAAVAGADTAMTAAWTPLDFQIEYEVDESVLRVLVVADSINEGITGPPGTSASNVVPQPLSTAPPNRWAASVGAAVQLHAVAGISTLNFVNIPDLFDRMNIEQLRPHIILWGLGANDLMGSTTVTGAEFVNNMGSALAIVRSRVGYGPRLYVNNVMPRGGITAAQQTSRTNFNAAIAARPHGAVAMIDMDSAMRNPASTNALLPALTNDTIHPSYEGQQVMSDVYRNTLPSAPPAVTASPAVYPTMTQAQYDALGASRDPNGIYPIRG